MSGVLFATLLTCFELLSLFHLDVALELLAPRQDKLTVGLLWRSCRQMQGTVHFLFMATPYTGPGRLPRPLAWLDLTN